MINEEMKKKAMQRAEENYAGENMNCAEAVMEALVHAGALSASKKVVAMACGFGGGGGMTGGSCGALCAAIMAVGHEWGREDPYALPADQRIKDVRMKGRRYNNMVAEFTQKFGSSLCGEICKQAGGYPKRRSTCNNLVPWTTDLAIKYLNLSAKESDDLPYQENIAGLK